MAPSPTPNISEGPKAGRAIRRKLKESEEVGTRQWQDSRKECDILAQWLGLAQLSCEL
jgi:hypothetical protein